MGPEFEHGSPIKWPYILSKLLMERIKSREKCVGLLFNTYPKMAMNDTHFCSPPAKKKYKFETRDMLIYGQMLRFLLAAHAIKEK